MEGSLSVADEGRQPCRCTHERGDQGAHRGGVDTPLS